MTQRGSIRGVPREFLVTGTWPDGQLRADTPIGVRYAAAITRNLKVAMEGRTQSGLAEEISIARSTLHDILTGRSWPDLSTLAKLEDALEARLWPDRHHV